MIHVFYFAIVLTIVRETYKRRVTIINYESAIVADVLIIAFRSLRKMKTIAIQAQS